jgi:hypothetical protein
MMEDGHWICSAQDRDQRLGSSEYDIGPSGSIKCGVIRDYVSKYSIVKDSSSLSTFEGFHERCQLCPVDL